MAYSLIKTFNLAQSRKVLFQKVESVAPEQWLDEALSRGMQLFVNSEKARSELIVMPLLLTIRNLNQNCFSIYSGEKLDGAPDKGLKGECDFILTCTPPLPAMQAPIVTIVEAKKQDIAGALGQCAAQMLGARLFNRGGPAEIETIFGCVTTGEAWQFLQLEDEFVHIDSKRYYINNVGQVLGVFQVIIDFYKQLPETVSG